MTDHDPLCQAALNGNDDIYFCVCEFIAKVRADERERTPVVYGYTAVLTNLRAKVDALPTYVKEPDAREYVILADVLALFDGSA